MNLDYKDIVLQPSKKMCTILSRDSISTNLNFLGRTYKSPAIPANMACTIDLNLANHLDNYGFFYILHRFYPKNKILNWLKDNKLSTISISIGVKKEDIELIDIIVKENLRVDFITIDVAHGHHILVKDMVYHIKKWKNNKFKPKIIAGNIATYEAACDYKKWGVDAAKVGLSRGRACSTYGKTGVGSFMFSAVQECFEAEIPLIADGGIREIGDISKALVAGADMVMIGSLFCQCYDSPAEIIQPYIGNDTQYKIYYGSASSKNKGYNRYVEGQESVWLDINNLSYLSFLDKIREGIVSTMSYNNSKNLSDLANMEYRSIK